MTRISWTCPACLRPQALGPNVLAPRDRFSVYVQCPGCQSVAVHTPHPSQLRAVLTWASVNVECDVAIFRRQLSDRRLAEFVGGGA